MKLPLQITFRNMGRSDLIEKWVGEEAEKLDSFYNRIMSCRVVVEVPHRHHRQGSPYNIRIDLRVPGEEIVVKREPSLNRTTRNTGVATAKKQLDLGPAYKDLRAALSKAFATARRRLQDYARRRRGQVKGHIPLPLARVSKLMAASGYGFLTTDDGREIYFHKNCVLGEAFSRLRVGSKVRFIEERGDKGPQASTVRMAGKNTSRGNAKRRVTLAA